MTFGISASFIAARYEMFASSQAGAEAPEKNQQTRCVKQAFAVELANRKDSPSTAEDAKDLSGQDRSFEAALFEAPLFSRKQKSFALTRR